MLFSYLNDLCRMVRNITIAMDPCRLVSDRLLRLFYMNEVQQSHPG
jgi:hypothetical protein